MISHQGNYVKDLQDADSAISIVASQCAATAECPLHEATAEAVEKRFFGIIESLRTKVVTIYGGVETMVYVDHKLALAAVGAAISSPYALIAQLFEALSDLEKGNGLKIYNIFGNLTVTCQDCQPLTVAQAGGSPGAGLSIQCADSSAISDDFAFLSGIYNSLSAETYFADLALPFSVHCV